LDTKLYVGNLSPVTTGEDLRMLFNTVGRVISVELIKDKKTGKSKGFAFVEMISQGDAGKAVSEFNGYQLDRQRLNVKAAKAGNRPSRRTPQGYVEYKSYNESVKPSEYNNRRY
jgi:RNA recognition motif-containing protein